jgi:hypothetical protein
MLMFLESKYCMKVLLIFVLSFMKYFSVVHHRTVAPWPRGEAGTALLRGGTTAPQERERHCKYEIVGLILHTGMRRLFKGIVQRK